MGTAVQLQTALSEFELQVHAVQKQRGCSCGESWALLGAPRCQQLISSLAIEIRSQDSKQNDSSSDVLQKGKKRFEEIKQKGRLGCPVHCAPDSNDMSAAEVKTFDENQADLQWVLTKKQNEQLSHLQQSTARLAESAQVINHELSEQSQMLTELDDEVGRQAGAMGAVMNRMSVVLKTNNRRQIKQVLILALIFVILVFLFVIT